MIDIIRDASAGQLLRLVFPKLLPYADERSDYIVPEKYQLRSGASTPDKKRKSTETLVGKNDLKDPEKGPQQEPESQERQLEEYRETLQRVVSGVSLRGQGDDSKPPADSEENSQYTVVDWDGDDDPDRPLNWSTRKRYWVVAQVMLLTFSIYIGSAIYVPAIPGIMEHFGVSQVRATWGMTLFIFAYGLGPMILAPLQDMHRFGRNPVYIIGLFLFVIWQLPIFWAPNLATVLAFRFLTGFVGSPALATGGASVGDVVPPQQLPVVIALWAIGAVCGPVMGPVIGGFAAEAKGWQWPIFELCWLAAFSFCILFVSFPETLESKILYNRARRLRKFTGNPMLRSQGEIEARSQSTADFWKHALLRPFQLFSEPAVLFSNIYIGICYALFYLWFESFPLVFNEIYGFSLGTGGLPYLGFLVSAAITFPAYVIYQKQYIDRKWAREGGLQPEVRLEIALFGSIFVPIAVLLFGWLSRPSIPWIVPIIMAALYLPGLYLIFQGLLIYIASSYPPRDAASILAGNDLARSSLASVFPLFGSKYFRSAIGLGGGSTLLAGISAAMIPVLFALYKKGGDLRARSKYAH